MSYIFNLDSKSGIEEAADFICELWQDRAEGENPEDIYIYIRKERGGKKNCVKVVSCSNPARSEKGQYQYCFQFIGILETITWDMQAQYELIYDEVYGVLREFAVLK